MLGICPLPVDRCVRTYNLNEIWNLTSESSSTAEDEAKDRKLQQGVSFDQTTLSHMILLGAASF